MKIALFSDIHGNLPALEAVMQDARSRNAVKMILNLGDSIGYGPEPEGVVRWINNPAFISVLGNYDKKVLSKRHRKTNWSHVRTPEKQAMFAWTHSVLSKQSRNFLKTLPETRLIEKGGLRILMVHDSSDASLETSSQDDIEKHLEELAADTAANIVLCGHTHRAFIRKVNGVHFVNPGSVGRPDDGDPRASYAILHLNQGTFSAELFSVPYNLMAAIQSLRQAGLPEVFVEVLRQGLNMADVFANFGNPPVSSVLEPNGTVSLLTDFSIKDHFIGVMKGVIASIAPQAKMIDISHQISPQNILEGARMLAEAAPYFPHGTVHIAVVDPGVGTDRRAIAARIGKNFYVAPHNGLLTPIIQKAREKGLPMKLIALDAPRYWLSEPSRTFHGRDIFAPVGAHLANGLPLEKLGNVIDDPILLALSKPEKLPGGWLVEVVMVDVFGNLSTNLPANLLPKDTDRITVSIGGEIIHGLTPAFADEAPGSLIATIDSTGHLALSVVNGNAADRLGAGTGTPVKILFETSK